MSINTPSLTISLSDEAASLKFAATLMPLLGSSARVFLEGNLGAGKTTLVRGCLRAIGFEGPVKSPTFTLVEEYRIPGSPVVYHFDLYRLADPEELEWMGIRDYLGEHSICFIEWPERGRGFLPEPDLEIVLTYLSAGRQISIRARSERGAAIINACSVAVGTSL